MINPTPQSRWLLVICSAASIYSVKADPQWESCRGNLPGWVTGQAIDAFDSDKVVVCIDDGGVYRTTDGGKQWERLPFPAPLAAARAMDVSMPDPSQIWAATDNGNILRWQVQTGSWQVQFSDTNRTQFMNYVRMFDVDNGIAMGDAKTDPGPALFLRTSDGGVRWNSVNDSAFGGWSGNTWRRMDFVSPVVGFFYESGVNPQKMYKTVDGCAHWSAVGPDTLHPMAIKFYDENVGLAHAFWWRSSSATGMCIARTTNGGSTWEVFARPPQGYGNDMEFIPGNPSRVWMTDNFGLSFSSDTGRTWTEVLASSGRDLVFTDRVHGWLLGDNGILLATVTGGGITGLDRLTDVSLSGFSLEQNYPNPFNPDTEISYLIADRAQVRLAVYDLLGREIAVLVNSPKEKGRYTVTFNGRRSASGVYFYRLTARGSMQTRRMMLVK
jgi:photosystem II stability/assembly factor-like uncharacterized protein